MSLNSDKNNRLQKINHWIIEEFKINKTIHLYNKEEGKNNIYINKLKKANRTIINLSQLSFRLLSYILYSYLFFVKLFTSSTIFDHYKETEAISLFDVLK